MLQERADLGKFRKLLAEERVQGVDNASVTDGHLVFMVSLLQAHTEKKKVHSEATRKTTVSCLSCTRHHRIEEPRFCSCKKRGKLTL